jgi:hypothetical protein
MQTRITAAAGKATLSLLRPMLLRLTYRPATEVLPSDAEDILRQSLGLVGGEPYALLVDMPAILSMSLGARKLFGAEDMVLAAAMLGNTPMDQVHAASMTRSVHEVQYFDDQNTALSWLISYLPAQTCQAAGAPSEVGTKAPTSCLLPTHMVTDRGQHVGALSFM